MKNSNDFKPFAEIMKARESEKDALFDQLERKNNSFEILKKNFASGCSSENNSA